MTYGPKRPDLGTRLLVLAFWAFMGVAGWLVLLATGSWVAVFLGWAAAVIAAVARNSQ